MDRAVGGCMHKNDLQLTLEKLCPHRLARFEYNGFLHQGIIKNIQKLAFTLGLSRKSLTEAINNKVDCLVVHNSPENISNSEDAYFKEVFRMIQQNELLVYRLHLPLDFAKGGIIDQLCKILQFKAKPTTLIYEGKIIRGGVYLTEEEVSLNEIVNRVRLLNPKTIRMVRGRKKQVKNTIITSGDVYLWIIESRIS
jgi:putative NIF3 family GTP cyclohydrolase 1 type 2